MAGSATLLMVSLAQLMSLKNETTYKFCDSPNIDVPSPENRLSFNIQSPNWPQPYDASKDCTIKFNLPQNSPNGTEERAYSLYLSCTDGFKMQDKPGGGGLGEGICSDFLQVNDMQACGNDLNEKNIHHIITGPLRKNGLVMRFKSDETVNEKGFRCHGMIDSKRTCSKNVFLTSPDNPSEIIEGIKLKKLDSAMTDCSIHVVSDSDYHVKITFLEFNLAPVDGDYCIAIGHKPENLYCSSADRGEKRWPPQSIVIEPHNNVIDVRLITIGLEINRAVSLDKNAFIIEATLSRGVDNAGSAAHLIFPDPNNPQASWATNPNHEGPGLDAPKPPEQNRVYRQMMVPIPAPDKKDACMCWEFPPDNIFLSMMALGHSKK